MKRFAFLGNVRTFAVVACWLSTSWAMADDSMQNAKAHLAAGEFAKARQIAQALPEADRNALLGQMAQQQAAAGARQGSFATMQAMGSSTDRSSVADSIRNAPFFPGVGGGGVIADFDTLIELITTTITPDSWTDNGGTGSISGFPTGVIVSDKGVLSRVAAETGGSLSEKRRASLTAAPNRNPRIAAKLRKVSLPRLEQAAQLRYAQGHRPDETMQNLAGLQRIEYIFVYEESGDIVLAGPAGDWNKSDEGRTVSTDSGRAVVQLDDLIVVLRNSRDSGTFGCAITPTRENLEAAQKYLAETGKKPLAPGNAAREKWVQGLRESLGMQEIEVHGIDPHSRTARTIVEADYHMKLVGMGLEKGVLGVSSYLDSMNLKPGEAAPPLGVLRWWFTLGDGVIRADDDGNSFQLKGPSAKVLSENERLNESGERIHTGKSEELNALFATSFTKHFDALVTKYPVYGDLSNIFDLATAMAVLKHEHAFDRTQWDASFFRDEKRCVIETGPAPEKVKSVANYRLINQRTLVAGASGGVEVDPGMKLKGESYQTSSYGDLEAGRKQSVRKLDRPDVWWWD